MVCPILINYIKSQWACCKEARRLAWHTGSLLQAMKDNTLRDFLPTYLLPVIKLNVAVIHLDKF